MALRRQWEVIPMVRRMKVNWAPDCRLNTQALPTAGLYVSCPECGLFCLPRDTVIWREDVLHHSSVTARQLASKDAHTDI